MCLRSPGSIVNIQNASAKVVWFSAGPSINFFVQETLTHSQEALHSKITLFLFFVLLKQSIIHFSKKYSKKYFFPKKKVFYFSFKLHISDKILTMNYFKGVCFENT